MDKENFYLFEKKEAEVEQGNGIILAVLQVILLGVAGVVEDPIDGVLSGIHLGLSVALFFACILPFFWEDNTSFLSQNLESYYFLRISIFGSLVAFLIATGAPMISAKIATVWQYTSERILSASGILLFVNYFLSSFVLKRISSKI